MCQVDGSRLARMDGKTELTGIQRGSFPLYQNVYTGYRGSAVGVGMSRAPAGSHRLLSKSKVPVDWSSPPQLLVEKGFSGLLNL